MNIILSIIYFVGIFTFMLKKVYLFWACKKVYIPLYDTHKNLFISDVPLKKSKNCIKLFYSYIFILFIIIFVFENIGMLTFTALISSFLIGSFTFKAAIFELNFISTFKDYLK